MRSSHAAWAAEPPQACRDTAVIIQASVTVRVLCHVTHTTPIKLVSLCLCFRSVVFQTLPTPLSQGLQPTLFPSTHTTLCLRVETITDTVRVDTPSRTLGPTTRYVSSGCGVPLSRRLFLIYDTNACLGQSLVL